MSKSAQKFFAMRKIGRGEERKIKIQVVGENIRA